MSFGLISGSGASYLERHRSVLPSRNPAGVLPTADIPGAKPDKIDSVLSYYSSLRMAVRLVLREPAFFGERKTFSFKFIRVARFLKDNAPHVFQITEMGSKSKNTMDRWLWDLLD